MGKRYVIEMEDSAFVKDEPFCDEEDCLYRVKGFRSLVFDKNGIEKLESHNVDLIEANAFKDGEIKAVKMLKWLYENTPDPKIFSGKTFGEILCDEDEDIILEVVKGLMKAGFHKKGLGNDIRIGDEVMANYSNTIEAWYVLKINGDICEGVDKNLVYHSDRMKHLCKTGNRKPNIRDTIVLAKELPDKGIVF